MTDAAPATPPSPPQLPLNALPLILGVTGHRDLVEADLPMLRERVAGLLTRIKQRNPSTPVLLLSALAEGADQLVADQALNAGVYLAVVLPMPEAIYRTALSDEAQQGFDRLLGRASLVIRLPLYASEQELASSEAAHTLQYQALASYLAMHCQAVVALWDGADTGLNGGTFDVVRRVLEGERYENCMEPLGGTVYQIVTPRRKSAARPEDALALHVYRAPEEDDEFRLSVPASTLNPAAKKGKEAATRNAPLTPELVRQWRLVPRPGLRGWLARVSVDSWLVARLRNARPQQIVEALPTELSLERFNRASVGLTAADLKWPLQPGKWTGKPWAYLERIEAIYLRADKIALNNQTTKRKFLWSILGCALLAVAGMEAHAHLLHEVDLLWFGFPGFILLAGGIYFLARSRAVENQFLDARVLAEALRVQYYWELGGVRKPVWQHYLTHRPSELGWVVAGLRGLALLEQDAGSKDAPSAQTRANIEAAATTWVKGQATYYQRTSEKHRKKREGGEARSSYTLLGVVLASLLVGFIVIVPVPALEGVKELIAHYRGMLHFLMAILLVLAGIEKVVLENEGYDEQSRSYRRMAHLFEHRSEQVQSFLDQDEVLKAINVLHEIGIRALEEHSVWLLAHREHALKVTGGA